MICEKKNQEPRLGARAQALLEVEDNMPLQNIRYCGIKTSIKSLNLRMPKTPPKNASCIFDTFISSLLYLFV
jgi:hypothetical protein